MDNEYCERCKIALVRCSACHGSGKDIQGKMCIDCRGTGYRYPQHDGVWKKQK